MTAPIWPVAMVTGHRPQHFDPNRPDVFDWLSGELRRVLAKLRAENGTGMAISGMAAGTDLLWANAAVMTKMPLRAHVPYPQQPDAWWRDRELQRQWRRLVDYAGRTGGVETYGDLDNYTDAERKGAAVGLLHDRNRGMIRETVAAAGVVVVVLRESRLSGGTRSVWNEIKDKSGLAIVRLDPDARTVRLASAGRRQETLL